MITVLQPGRPAAASRVHVRHARLYLIFFVGGMPALIYQVAWQRVLTLYFGVDIYSTSVTVATFMLGLGFGSLFGGRIADRIRHPARAYAAVEVLMGVFGWLSLPLFAAAGQLFAGASLPVVIGVDALLLLVPTTLMGMTLPLMCRVVIGAGDGIGRQLAWLYGVNTLGAAIGALLSAYLLIGVFGLDGATRIAASVNLLLAAAVSALVATRGHGAPASGGPGPIASPGGSHASSVIGGPRQQPLLPYGGVLACSCLSGAIALGYEIVWYRVLAILLHGTVYVFGTILFFHLVGIALGSLLARTRADEPGAIDRFAAAQLGIAVYAVVVFQLLGRFSSVPPLRELIAASFFTSFHPAPELLAGRVDLFSIYSLLDIAGWTLLVLGIPSVLMGYGFANLMREGSRHVDRIGHAVGAIYFANILGSAAGSLLVGFVLIHDLGTAGAARVLVLAGICMPLALLVARRNRSSQFRLRSRSARWASACCVLASGGALTFPTSERVIRSLHYADQDGVAFIGAEDRTGVSALRRQERVVAFQQEAAVLGQQRLYIDGSHHGDGLDVPDADPAVLFALAAHPAPRRVLVIGLGDGHMAATAVRSPEVGDVTIVELNGTLGGILRHTKQGALVLGSEKVTYVVDDGRRWLLAHPGERFDVIMMFPLHAAHAFSGALYSLEFLQVLSDRLAPGGVVMLRTADLYSTARTVATVFPYVLCLDQSVYVAGRSPLALARDRLPFSAGEASRRITADRAAILAHTIDARLNRDFAPNSEYYVTYPYVAVLQTRVRSSIAYRAAAEVSFRELLPEAGAGTDRATRDAGSSEPDGPSQ